MDLISRVTKVNDEGVVDCTRGGRAPHAFTLVEILVVVVLMSLIVLSLMAVFNSTQAAFRASITQTDVMEGGRSVMGLIKSDLEGMTPTRGLTYGYYTNKCGNTNFIVTDGAVNFCVVTNQYQYQSNAAPLVQSLVGVSDPNTRRTNVLENFFILTRQNMTWTGVGYVVDTTSTNYLNPLYRFSMTTNVLATGGPAALYTNFLSAIAVLPIPPNATNLSHLVDGVVHLTVHASDVNGAPIYFVGTNIMTIPLNFSCGIVQEPIGYVFYSNALPAAVEIQLGILEDRTLQRAESIPDSITRSSYLAQHAGQVHLFRQRFPIRNIDPSAYQ